MLKTLLLALATLAAGTAIASQPFISEVLMNAPNGSDDNREFFEIQGPAGFNLDGYYFLSIDGDGTAAGGVDQVISLSGLSTGLNGLLLVQDPNIVLFPSPDPLTNISIVMFTPDIENGSNTFVLGYGTPPTVGDDLDSDNDGTLNSGALAGFTVVDAVSLAENDGASNYEYADDLGFASANLGSDAGFNADELYRVLNTAGTAPAGWALGDVLGVDPGPFNFDALRSRNFDTFGYPDPSLVLVSPGTLNISAVASGFSFEGTVGLSDYIGSPASQTVTIEVVDGSNQVVQTHVGPLSATSTYSFTSTLPAGTYTLKAKGANWLRKNQVKVIDGTSNQVVNFTLTNGDADGDNEVSIGDFAIISSNFGSAGPQGDLDGDEEVNIGDFSIMSANFGMVGDD